MTHSTRPTTGAALGAQELDRAFLSGLKVLVVGINYWPEPTGIAPYTTGMAEFLAASGAQVQVLTGIPSYPSWKIPEHYPRRPLVREIRRGVDIWRVAHYIPRRMTAVQRALYEATFLAHARLRGLGRRPDLVLSCTPAVGGAVAASRIAAKAGCPLVVVVQDLTAAAAGQSGIASGGGTAAIAARLEGLALRAASTVAVVSPAFTGAVCRYGVAPERVRLLRNWTHITPTELDRDDARRALGWSPSRFLAVHTGNMGYKQDLGNLVETARHLRGSPVDILLVGDGSQRPALMRQAAGASNLEFIEPLSGADYPLALAAADVLLVNERASVEDMSLPSKITSYLAAGRPVVAAVRPGGATSLELAATGGAALLVPPADPAELAATLRGLLGARATLDAMAVAALRHATESLTAQRAQQDLVSILRDACAAVPS